MFFPPQGAFGSCSWRVSPLPSPCDHGRTPLAIRHTPYAIRHATSSSRPNRERVAARSLIMPFFSVSRLDAHRTVPFHALNTSYVNSRRHGTARQRKEKDIAEEREREASARSAETRDGKASYEGLFSSAFSAGGVVEETTCTHMKETTST